MSENNENFESLQKLLALKRHEVPPPGYFEDFSSQIVARLKAGEGKGSAHWSEQFAVESPWIVRFLRFFEAKPAIVGGMAAMLCVLLVIGMMYSGNEGSGDLGLNTPSSPMASSTPIASSQSSPQLLASVGNLADNSSGLSITTNFSLQPVSSVFGGQQNPFSLPVSFSPNGN